MRLYDDIFNVISVQKWWIDNNLCYFINVLSNAIHSIKNLFWSLLYLNIMFNLNKAIKLILHKIYIKPTRIEKWQNFASRWSNKTVYRPVLPKKEYFIFSKWWGYIFDHYLYTSYSTLLTHWMRSLLNWRFIFGPFHHAYLNHLQSLHSQNDLHVCCKITSRCMSLCIIWFWTSNKITFEQFKGKLNWWWKLKEKFIKGSDAFSLWNNMSIGSLSLIIRNLACSNY